MAEPIGHMSRTPYQKESTGQRVLGMVVTMPVVGLIFIPAMVLMLFSIVYDIFFVKWIKSPLGIMFYKAKRARRAAKQLRK